MLQAAERLFFTRKSAINLPLGLSCTESKTRAEDRFMPKELMVCSGRSQMDTAGHGHKTADTG